MIVKPEVAWWDKGNSGTSPVATNAVSSCLICLSDFRLFVTTKQTRTAIKDRKQHARLPHYLHCISSHLSRNADTQKKEGKVSMQCQELPARPVARLLLRKTTS